MATIIHTTSFLFWKVTTFGFEISSYTEITFFYLVMISYFIWTRLYALKEKELLFQSLDGFGIAQKQKKENLKCVQY